jgi:hypothetical protein
VQNFCESHAPHQKYGIGLMSLPNEPSIASQQLLMSQ